MMGGIVIRNMYSKAIAKNKRNCCILLDLFHYKFRVSRHDYIQKAVACIVRNESDYFRFNGNKQAEAQKVQRQRPQEREVRCRTGRITLGTVWQVTSARTQAVL